jgi:rod shape-determining protein MreD
MIKSNFTWPVLVLVLFLTAFLEAVLIPFPVTLILIIILTFYHGEKVFVWAFWVGLWQDLLSWHHLGSWSIVFLVTAYLVNYLKCRVFGLDQEKLSLPD